MKILYFAWLRQKTGIDSEQINMPNEVCTVADLIAWLKTRNSDFADAFSDFNSIVKLLKVEK